MSLRAVTTDAIPEETARIARAAFPKGSVAMTIRDGLACIYRDEQFQALYGRRGQPGFSAWRLALVSILQYTEGLSDRQAADAVRGRIDWKYALGLELDDPGFDASILTEFRGRLLEAGQADALLNQLLQVLVQQGLLKAGTRQRTDSTHVWGAVRDLNRLTLVIETLRHVLDDLAQVAPDWLRGIVEPSWFDRYSRRADDFHLPTARTERARLARQVGEDGWKVLQALDSADSPTAARALSRVAILRQIWHQQYAVGPKTIRWRKAKELPRNAELVVSPSDPEVRASKKRDEYWMGYKVHLTETCEADAPHLITHVQTMTATTQDDQALLPIHTALQHQALLPAQHIVDAGYTNAAVLATSQHHFGVDLVGKVSVENGWQARTPDAFPASAFHIDFAAQVVTCPAGQHSNTWTLGNDGRGQPIIRTHFPRQVCLACPWRARCTRHQTRGRCVGFRPQPQHEALQRARDRQTFPAFATVYALRAGVEATLAQAIRRCDLRQARYIGLPKTHLQHVLVALALNVVRVCDWLAGKPLAKTRQTPFAKLAPAA